MAILQHVIRLEYTPWEDFKAKNLIKFKEALKTCISYKIPRQVIINYDKNSGRDVRDILDNAL